MWNSSSRLSSSASRLRAVRLDDLQHRADVVLDREPAEDRRFLRQIADAEPRALIHRQRRDIVAVEIDAPAIRLDQPGDHVEHRGLAGAVRSQQADRLAAAHVEAHALDHLAPAEAFLDAAHREEVFAALGLRHRRTLLLAMTLAGILAWISGGDASWLLIVRRVVVLLIAVRRIVRFAAADRAAGSLAGRSRAAGGRFAAGSRAAARRCGRGRCSRGGRGRCSPWRGPCRVLAAGLRRFLRQVQRHPGQRGDRPAQRPQVDAPEAGRRLSLASRIAAEEGVKHVCLGSSALPCCAAQFPAFPA